MNTKKVFYLLIFLAALYNLIILKSCTNKAKKKQETTLISTSNPIELK